MNCNICKTEMVEFKEDLYVCNSCDLISSSLLPDETIYDVGYYKKYVGYEHSDLNHKIQCERSNLVFKYLKKGTLLDFGCGSGAFLKYCESKLDVKGFDINPNTGNLNFSNLFDDYEAVTFWDSLEHVKNPKKVLKALNPYYVFICTPSTDDIDLNNILNWRHYRPKEHIHYFSKDSLEKLLDSCGYGLLEFNYKESMIRRGGKDKNLITVVGRKIC